MLKTTDPEFRLVAACCRPTGQAGRRDAIAAAALETFDAERLLALAHAHRVEALVEDGLTQAGVALPEKTADLLARRVRAARLQMLRNAGEEVRLSELLRDAGIDAVFVKGATLAMLAHGSLAHKASWDIDLLVARQSIHQAVGILRDAGYEFDHPAIAKAGLALRFASRVRESSWTNAERCTTVELHWALAHNPLLLTGIGISSQRQNILVADHRAVPTLATPDLFSFLAVHGTAHEWSRLKWLADIASLVEVARVPLTELYDHARRSNSGRCAAVALLLIRDLLGVTIPDHVKKKIDCDRQARRLADTSLHKMLVLAALNGKPDHGVSDWWTFHVSHMRMAPGLRFGLADISAKLNQPLGPRRLRLPKWLLIPDALFIWIPLGFMRRIAVKLQSLWPGNVANNR